MLGEDDGNGKSGRARVDTADDDDGEESEEERAEVGHECDASKDKGPCVCADGEAIARHTQGGEGFGEKKLQQTVEGDEMKTRSTIELSQGGVCTAL